MASHNIQHLFSVIRPEQVEMYLSGSGWRCHKNAGRLIFELPPGADGEARQLSLPADPAHPKLRNLLPNVIFGLAVIEKREALDIANAIADLVVPDPSVPPQVSVPTQVSAPTQPSNEQATPRSTDLNSTSQWTLQLINGLAERSLHVRSQFNQETYEVGVGQTLQVNCRPGTTCKVHLMSDCEVGYEGTAAPQFIQGYPIELDQWRQRGWDSQTGLTNYFQQHIVPLMQTGEHNPTDERSNHNPKRERGSSDTQALASWVETTVAEFCFMVGTKLENIEPSTLKRASARALGAVHQQFAGHNQSTPAEVLVQLARVLMGLGKHAIIADASSAESLTRILNLDSPAAPHKTLEWLSMHAQRL